jgi:hypothetical protein
MTGLKITIRAIHGIRAIRLQASEVPLYLLTGIFYYRL